MENMKAIGMPSAILEDLQLIFYMNIFKYISEEINCKIDGSLVENWDLYLKVISFNLDRKFSDFMFQSNILFLCELIYICSFSKFVHLSYPIIFDEKSYFCNVFHFQL